MTVSELASKARSGDTAAQTELFELLRVRFLLIAKQYMQQENAEDVAQDACLTIAQKYAALGSTEAFEPWAYRILRNKIGNFLKHKQVQRRILSESTPTDTVASSDRADHASYELMIVEGLRRVAARDVRYVRILNLLHLGYSVEEICERLGISRNHLYVLLHRGRALLQEYLRDSDDRA